MTFRCRVSFRKHKHKHKSIKAPHNGLGAQSACSTNEAAANSKWIHNLLCRHVASRHSHDVSNASLFSCFCSSRFFLCSLFGDFWRKFVPPLFFVPPNAPALRAPHLAGRAIVLSFLFIGFRWRWVCSLCRRSSQNELCAWANERELFDTFPGFGVSGVDPRRM